METEHPPFLNTMNLLKLENHLKDGGFTFSKERSRLVRSLNPGDIQNKQSISIPLSTDLLHIYRQSAYLIGRDRAVADIHTEHPSCSKQHAALQFRQVTIRSEFGDTAFLVKCALVELIIILRLVSNTHVLSRSQIDHS